MRSSSTLEDLAGAAFAGQHDTYLNVTSPGDVEDAVRRCFASLWEDRAVSYRHARGFPHANAAMAVLVQLMVASDVAGVAFGLNPVTGDLRQIVVNAAFGLGETVVSGEGEVDQFVLDKKSGEVRESLIGEKTHARHVVSRLPGNMDVALEAGRTYDFAVARRDLSWFDRAARGVQPAADGGAEALGAARDEHAAAGVEQGGFHGVVAVRSRRVGDVTIPEPVRRVSVAGFAR